MSFLFVLTAMVARMARGRNPAIAIAVGHGPRMTAARIAARIMMDNRAD
jgi:hypothetical protein